MIDINNAIEEDKILLRNDEVKDKSTNPHCRGPRTYKSSTDYTTHTQSEI